MNYQDNEVTVIIDNPVLLEILQKYKDMGLFGDHDPIFGIGKYESTYEDGNYEGDGETPAFYYYENYKNWDEEFCGLNLWYGAPSSLEEVLKDLISLLEAGKEYLDEAVLTELIEELRRRGDEIKLAYSKVSWSNYQEYETEESEYYFYYDPVNGEKYSYKSPEEFQFFNTLENKDPEEEEELRDQLGYGESGNENDDYWEYAKKVGYFGDFDNFPMDGYNKYKDTGEIKLCEEWLNLFGTEDVEEEDGEEEDKGAE